MNYPYRSKRDAIRALIGVYGDGHDRWDEIAEGFWLLAELQLFERGEMADARTTARTMLYHRASGRHDWPETAGPPAGETPR